MKKPYSIILIVIFLLQLIVFIIPAQVPRADFNVIQTEGCSPLSVCFTNTSVDAVSYSWDFGNGNVSTLKNPANIYTSSGNYTVKLIAISENGQRDSVIKKNLVSVSENAIANFTVENRIDFLSGNSFSFVNNSTHSESWLWDFGDGTTSTLQHPVHSYATEGKYTIKLVAYNVHQCSNLSIEKEYLEVISKPVPDFSVDKTKACQTTELFHFTPLASSANSWHWDFGDGTVSTNSNPQHNYKKEGVYNVVLITRDGDGFSDTIIKKDLISISTDLVPTFTVNTNYACTDVPVQFVNTSSKFESCTWDFGDGEKSELTNPNHSYKSTGDYTIKLTLKAKNQCLYTAQKENFIQTKMNAVSTFALSNGSGCSPLHVQFVNSSTNDNTRLWEFGDGSTSTEKNPSHIYVENGSYSVTLHSYTSTGCEAKLFKNNAVKITPPSAKFKTNNRTGCSPLTVRFSNTSLAATQWFWDFGDGETSNLEHPEHIFRKTGSFTVRLIASDSKGCTDTISYSDYIQVTSVTADYSSPPLMTGCAPMTFDFKIPGNNQGSCLWDFGDGTTSTQQNPSHTFVKDGVFEVSLTIESKSGCSLFYNNFRSFIVEGARSDFNYEVINCSPYTVQFADKQTDNIISSFWDFGDGSTSTLKSPVHSYVSGRNYSIKHKVESSSGCFNESFKINYIHAVPCNEFEGATGEIIMPGTPVADLFIGEQTTNLLVDSVSPFTGCVPLLVSFYNVFPSAISLTWDFGDGHTSTLENPTHIYKTNGIFDVTLIVQKQNGSHDTILYPNYIHTAGAIADFSYLQSTNCKSREFSFACETGNSSYWSWDFGDGKSSLEKNPKHSYVDSREFYPVTLILIDSSGCSGSMSKEIVLANGNATICTENYELCSNELATFRCSSSNFASYQWDFGDSTSSTVQNPFHEYNGSGQYHVSLKTIDNNGCINQFKFDKCVNVKQPLADFSSTLKGGCNSQTVNFINASRGTRSSLSSHCLWNFGDGTPAAGTENPEHTYANPGTYQVKLQVDQDQRCSNTIVKEVRVYPTVVANFSSVQQSNCFPIEVSFTDLSENAISWLWDFGDGDTSIIQNPTHTFYEIPKSGVTLTITDESGCKALFSKNEWFILSAGFTLSDTMGCAPLRILFSNSSQNAKEYFWDFGDGKTSTLKNPDHVYDNDGNYPVMLISTAGLGCVDTAFFNTVQVDKPKANFKSTNPTNCSPTLVTFTDLSEGAVSWLWDFGDGSTSTTQHPAHIYNVPGWYTVELLVINKMGCSDTLIKKDYVYVPGTIANFSISSDQFCVRSAINFKDESINATRWNWNFGDGSTSTEKSPSHQFQNSGRYPISLIVSDSFGCSSNFTLLQPVTIYSLPVADFSISDSVFCIPFAPVFKNNSENATTYLWDFGDSQSSLLESPVHKYVQAGKKIISLIATSESGCTDTSTFGIKAIQSPKTNFAVDVDKGCTPLTISFSHSSDLISDARYFWDFGNQSVSREASSKSTYLAPGKYAATLIISNEIGCSDTIIHTGIEVYDTIPPACSEIISATVLSDHSTYLIWNPTTALDFDHYQIFRKDLSTGKFIPVKRIFESTLVSFTDSSLNTLENSYCYKVQTVDRCGYSKPLDSLQEHCTINATAIGLKDRVRVNWTPYVGASVESYSVYRMNIGELTSTLITTVSSEVLTIIDTGLYCPVNYSYRVKANKINNKFIFSHSDTTISKLKFNVFENQKVDIVRSTVINNKEILTEWSTPIIAPERVSGYSIYRSKDTLDFDLIAKVDAAVHDYIDKEVDVNQQNYFYKIEAENSCNAITQPGNISSSILLKAELADGNVNLTWTGYEGWDMGVDYYIIEKMNERGEWETIKKVDGDQTYATSP